MSGVTSSAFRRFIRELNPLSVGYMVSEFISVEGLTRLGRKSLQMMRYQACERPLGIQIFGYDIERMCHAAQMVEASGVEVVDINCGCPAPKVVKRGGGCELMRQPEHLTRMIREVRKAISIPLTIKIRSGWDEKSLNALDIARMAESEGVNAITVHGRTRTALYRGSADWEIVARIVDTVSIPVFGSGDVVDAASARERLSSGVAGLYIGRAVLSDPFVFSKITAELFSERPVCQVPYDAESSEVPRILTDRAMATLLLRYRTLLHEEFSVEGSVGKIKQLASPMGRGRAWIKNLLRCMTDKEQYSLLTCIQENAIHGECNLNDAITYSLAESFGSREYSSTP
jgi:tRNA-dihydrouridine synthase B